MQVGVIGMSHKSAGVALRESFAKASERRFSGELSLHGPISYVLLSTCNRTELYFAADNLAEAHIYLLAQFRKEMSLAFEHTLYSFFGFDCFFHLASVTSGIQSAIVGETEIQGQVKCAYENTHRPLAKELHFLFQKSLKIGKKTRTCFQRSETGPTLEQTVTNSATYLLGDLAKRAILFVGASQINKKLLSHFKTKRYGNITVCNRTLARAKDIAAKQCLSYIPFEDLHTWSHYDLIIFGTKARHHLISKVPTLSRHPQLVIDLSVPRNVAPHLKINLLNVDDLKPPKTSQKTAFYARLQRQMISKDTWKQLAVFTAKEKLRSANPVAC